MTRKMTDMLWSDKDEIAARNNRNVTLRKLRVLLEEVGDVEVISDGGFLKIRWNESVFCDYCTALHCMDLLRRMCLRLSCSCTRILLLWQMKRLWGLSEKKDFYKHRA